MKCMHCGKEFEDTEHCLTVRTNLGKVGGHDFCCVEHFVRYHYQTVLENITVYLDELIKEQE